MVPKILNGLLLLISENIISPLAFRERNLLPDDVVGVEELSCENLMPDIPPVPELISSFEFGVIVQIPTFHVEGAI